MAEADSLKSGSSAFCCLRIHPRRARWGGGTYELGVSKRGMDFVLQFSQDGREIAAGMGAGDPSLCAPSPSCASVLPRNLSLPRNAPCLARALDFQRLPLARSTPTSRLVCNKVHSAFTKCSEACAGGQVEGKRKCVEMEHAGYRRSTDTLMNVVRDH